VWDEKLNEAVHLLLAAFAAVSKSLGDKPADSPLAEAARLDEESLRHLMSVWDTTVLYVH
jgi:hypothetical protein